MSSYLQQQLQTRTKAKNLSIYALEKKAGLKRTTVNNILRGSAKSPRGESLQAIANVLDCTVEDLIGPVSETRPSISVAKVPSNGSQKWNEKLYMNVIKLISKTLADKKLELKFEQVLALANEVYKYSTAKSSNKADQDFVTWLINKNF